MSDDHDNDDQFDPATATLGDALKNPLVLRAHPDIEAHLIPFIKSGGLTASSEVGRKLAEAFPPRQQRLVEMYNGYTTANDGLSKNHLLTEDVLGYIGDTSRPVYAPVIPPHPAHETNRQLAAMHEQIAQMADDIAKANADRAKLDKVKTRWKVAAYSGTIAVAIAVSPYAGAVVRWLGRAL